MGKVICAKCEFVEFIMRPDGDSCYSDGLTGDCISLDAPITDFVKGKKSCAFINKDGRCKHYKDRV